LWSNGFEEPNHRAAEASSNLPQLLCHLPAAISPVGKIDDVDALKVFRKLHVVPIFIA
jgi:hypothetical protein